MSIPEDLKYTKEHEWIKIENNTATFGITDFAQDKLGDIVYLDLPEADNHINQMDVAAVVESVKAASDIYMPLTGTITEVNEELGSAPELVNQSPYKQGWIAKITNFKEEELTGLLSSKEYEDFINTQS